MSDADGAGIEARACMNCGRYRDELIDVEMDDGEVERWCPRCVNRYAKWLP